MHGRGPLLRLLIVDYARIENASPPASNAMGWFTTSSLHQLSYMYRSGLTKELSRGTLFVSQENWKHSGTLVLNRSSGPYAGVIEEKFKGGMTEK